MNSAISNTAFEDYCLPVQAASQFHKPSPPLDLTDDLDEEVHVLRVLEPSGDRLSTDPRPDESHILLEVDRRLVRSSLLRRIEFELRNDVCDPHTVFNFCRGLEKGSLDFENAYFEARIRSFAKSKRLASDPLVVTQKEAEEWPVNSSYNIVNSSSPAQQHPLAVNSLGDLMSDLGIFVVGLLGIQFFAAWRIGAYMTTFLEGGRTFYFSATVFLILALDSAVWFRRRGNLSSSFLVPGAMLLVMALLPVLIFHVRDTVLAAR